jgi:hypothetical protein
MVFTVLTFRIPARPVARPLSFGPLPLSGDSKTPPAAPLTPAD